MIAFATVLLPQPDSPARPTTSPGADRQVDAVDRADRARRAVLDVETAQLDERLAGAVTASPRLDDPVTPGLADEQRRAPDALDAQAGIAHLVDSGEDERRARATVSASASPGKTNGHHSPCSTLELTAPSRA